jgi:hypothetical protein
MIASTFVSGVVRQRNWQKLFIKDSVSETAKAMVTGTLPIGFNDNTSPKPNIPPLQQVQKPLQVEKSMPLPPQEQFRAFIKKTRPMGWNQVTDALACSLVFYPACHKHYGFGREIHYFSSSFLPREWCGKEGRPLNIQCCASRDMGFVSQKSMASAVFGQWSEGWMVAGYTGSIVYCLLAGLIYGFYAKVITTVLRQPVLSMDELLIAMAFYCPFTLKVVLATYSWQTDFLRTAPLLLLAVASIIICRLFPRLDPRRKKW